MPPLKKGALHKGQIKISSHYPRIRIKMRTINNNADNIREAVISSIKDNTLFVGMVEKKTGIKTIYAYKFSTKGEKATVKIMNGNRYNNFFGIAVPKMIKEF